MESILNSFNSVYNFILFYFWNALQMNNMSLDFDRVFFVDNFLVQSHTLKKKQEKETQLEIKRDRGREREKGGG